MSRALVAIVAISLFGCGGPYDDLARDFGVDAEQTGETLRVERVVLISTKHRGAYNYRGILDVSLTANAIEIRPRFHMSLRLKPLRVPAEKVSGCSMTCFGVDDRRADFLFEAQGVEMSFDTASEVVAWCWRNNLPMVSGEHERGWLYSGRSLPEKAAYTPVSKEEYKQQADRACCGY